MLKKGLFELVVEEGRGGERRGEDREVEGGKWGERREKEREGKEVRGGERGEREVGGRKGGGSGSGGRRGGEGASHLLLPARPHLLSSPPPNSLLSCGSIHGLILS